MKDFSFMQYTELCTTLLERHNPISFAKFLTEKNENVAIIRHDIDKKPQNALIIAEIERNLGIQSTFYFRTIPEVFNLDIMKKIQSMGHEIGFHYEVLDKARGDIDKAIEIFENELRLFPFDIKTICMHGNPLTPWVNKDLWKRFDFKKYGIIGEAYLSINFSDLYYFSDTGRSWDGKYSVKDLSDACDEKSEKITSTKKLIEFIRQNDGNYYIVTHPQRWNDALIPWTTELICQSIKNIGKSGIKRIRERR
jgi:hypothetical protein